MRHLGHNGGGGPDRNGTAPTGCEGATERCHGSLGFLHRGARVTLPVGGGHVAAGLSGAPLRRAAGLALGQRFTSFLPGAGLSTRHCVELYCPDRTEDTISTVPGIRRPLHVVVFERLFFVGGGRRRGVLPTGTACCRHRSWGDGRRSSHAKDHIFDVLRRADEGVVS